MNVDSIIRNFPIKIELVVKDATLVIPTVDENNEELTDEEYRKLREEAEGKFVVFAQVEKPHPNGGTDGLKYKSNLVENPMDGASRVLAGLGEHFKYLAKIEWDAAILENQ